MLDDPTIDARRPNGVIVPTDSVPPLPELPAE